MIAIIIPTYNIFYSYYYHYFFITTIIYCNDGDAKMAITMEVKVRQYKYTVKAVATVNVTAENIFPLGNSRATSPISCSLL